MGRLIRNEHRRQGSPKKQFAGRPLSNQAIDLARQAKLIAPAVATTPTERRLQELWRQHPNRYDYEGIDTPGGAASKKAPVSSVKAALLRPGDMYFDPTDGVVRVRKVSPIDPKHPRTIVVGTSKGVKQFPVDRLIPVARPEPTLEGPVSPTAALVTEAHKEQAVEAPPVTKPVAPVAKPVLPGREDMVPSRQVATKEPWEMTREEYQWAVARGQIDLPRSVRRGDMVKTAAVRQHLVEEAIAQGKPDIMRSVTLKNEIGKLQLLQSSHFDAKMRAQEELRTLPTRIAGLKDSIGKMERDSALAQSTVDTPFAITLAERTYSERPDAGEALVGATKNAKSGDVIGSYRGFQVKVVDTGPSGGYKYVVVNPATGQEYSTSTIPYTALIPSGAIARIHNRVSGIPETLAQTQRALGESESSLNTYRERFGTPFAHEQRITEMQAELTSLERRLQEPVPAEAR